MSLIFGLISASLHQLWFFYNSKSDDFLSDLIVMFTGNIFGTLLVLVFAAFINMIVLKNIPKRIDDE
jgi:RsiW-degrading membrane proteinase PrsW (M82 family)